MYKRWVLWLLGLLITCLLGCVVVIFAVDPYQVYRRATAYRPIFYATEQAYNNAGLARNYPYDALIVGTSMTENFRPSLVDATFGTQSIKVPFAGGMACDHAAVLALALRTHALTDVFYGLDAYSFVEAPGTSSLDMPAYLYNDDPLDDVSYLLNGMVLFQRIPSIVKHNLLASDVLYTDRDALYAWGDAFTYGEAQALASYDFAQPAEPMLEAEAYEAHVRENLARYVQPYLEAHPETRFTFFFPPYSALQWYIMQQKGHLEAILYTREQLAETLLAYDNVRLYDFSAYTEWVTDLDLYMDYNHYGPEINDAMTRMMAGEECLVRDIYDIYEHGDVLYALAEDFPVPE